MRVSGRCWQGRWRVALSSLIEAARGLAAHDGPVTAPILVWTGSTQFSISAPRRGAQVAQSVEQRTENPCVGGSIPPLPTNTSGCYRLSLAGHRDPRGRYFLSRFMSAHDC